MGVARAARDGGQVQGLVVRARRPRPAVQLVEDPQQWLRGVPERWGPVRLAVVTLYARGRKRPARREQLRLPGVLEPVPCAPRASEGPSPGGNVARRSPVTPRKLPVITCRKAPPAASMERFATIATKATADMETTPLLPRPRTRADCADGPRPCPWVGCKHHLFLDVHPGSGSIKLNHPDTELEDMADTCALDVADRGGVGLLEIGERMGVTLERARQITAEAVGELRAGARRLGLDQVVAAASYVDGRRKPHGGR